MPGSPNRANSPAGECESSAPQRATSPPASGTAASTADTQNDARRFHLSGRGLGRTLSRPIVMNVPSLSRVISMSCRTGT
jgi:hypothetical protein